MIVRPAALDDAPAIAAVHVQAWQAAIERFNPGDRVKVQVERYGRTVEAELVVGGPSSFSYRLEDLPNASVEARRLRAAWLAGK